MVVQLLGMVMVQAPVAQNPVVNALTQELVVLVVVPHMDVPETLTLGVMVILTHILETLIIHILETPIMEILVVVLTFHAAKYVVGSTLRTSALNFLIFGMPLLLHI